MDQAALITSAERRLDLVFADTFATLRAQLEKALAELHLGADGKIEASTFNAARVRNLLHSLQVEARNAGMGNAIDSVVDELKTLSTSILDQAGDLGLSKAFTETTGQSVKDLIWDAQRTVIDRERSIASDLEKLLIRSYTGATKRDDLLLNIAAKLNGNMRAAITEASDVVANFATQTRVMHFSEAGLEWWLYDGPSDERTRAWCKAFVGRRVTMDMADTYATAYGRKHPLPPSISRGGWNCRHEWVPLVVDLKRYKIGPR